MILNIVCFQVMKMNFSGKPINHRLPEQIKAHFLICYAALLVYRLPEAFRCLHSFMLASLCCLWHYNMCRFQLQYAFEEKTGLIHF